MSGYTHSVEARHVARLGAVQALYQLEIGGGGHETVIREFEEHKFGKLVDEMEVPNADFPHFERLVRGVVDRQGEIDPAVNAVLRVGWPLARLDTTVRALLRAASFELLACKEIPPKVVLNEYIGLSREFFDGDEPAFINGVLDELARRMRGTDAA